MFIYSGIDGSSRNSIFNPGSVESNYNKLNRTNSENRDISIMEMCFSVGADDKTGGLV